ncbi:hypothetical protein BB558_001978 [Smittium angustum]|uniref:SMP-LTD domain-containing protein n=1 Tax=Smittium angustum TaxID=133377 RepID=A0A2U1JA50_SMIAN|nr:hypothetical protein BB558_001978 [Smittium angustum]
MPIILVYLAGLFTIPLVILIVFCYWIVILPESKRDLLIIEIFGYPKHSSKVLLELERIIVYLSRCAFNVLSIFFGDAFVSKLNPKKNEPNAEPTIELPPTLNSQNSSFETYSKKVLNDYECSKEIISGYLHISKPADSTLQSVKTNDFDKQNSTGNPKKNGKSKNSEEILEKKTRNSKCLYFVSLKGKTLFLYSNEDKVEGLGTIVLTEYNIELMSADGFGENRIYSKKLPILLKRKNATEKQTAESESLTSNISADTGRSITSSNIEYFLFAPKSVIKEDWYIYMSQAVLDGNNDEKLAYKRKCYNISFEQAKKHISDVYTYQTETQSNKTDGLHPDTRNSVFHDLWLNMLVSRIGLGIIKTKKIRHLLIENIKKKFSNLKFPSLIQEIHVVDLVMGDNVPTFSNTTLLSAENDGRVSVETNFDYNGGLSVLLQVDVKLMNLKLPIKIRMDIKKVKGTLIILIKQPPSNRIWIGFSEMPDIDMNLEPTILQKQINYNRITSALKSKLLESFASGFVLPNMSDSIFYTPGHNSNGGIFESEIYKVDTLNDDKKSNEKKTELLGKSASLYEKTSEIKPISRDFTFPTTKNLGIFKGNKERNELSRNLKQNNPVNNPKDKEKKSNSFWKFKNLIEIEKPSSTDPKKPQEPITHSQSFRIDEFSSIPKDGSHTDPPIKSTDSSVSNKDSFMSQNNNATSIETKHDSNSITNFDDLKVEHIPESELNTAFTNKSSLYDGDYSTEPSSYTGSFTETETKPDTKSTNNLMKSFIRYSETRNPQETPEAIQQTQSQTFDADVKSISIFPKKISKQNYSLGNIAQNNTTKQIASNLKTSVISSASELYSHAKQSNAAEAARKWLKKNNIKAGVFSKYSEKGGSDTSGNPKESLNTISEKQAETNGINSAFNGKDISYDGFYLPENHINPVTEPPKLPLRVPKQVGKEKVEDLNLFSPTLPPRKSISYNNSTGGDESNSPFKPALKFDGNDKNIENYFPTANTAFQDRKSSASSTIIRPLSDDIEFNTSVTHHFDVGTELPSNSLSLSALDSSFLLQEERKNIINSPPKLPYRN